MNPRLVETVFVFDRDAAADVSVAYSILVPVRRALIDRVGKEGRSYRDQYGHFQCSDLRPGVVASADERRDDWLSDRRAA